jgi:hypothetical protein
VGVGERGTSKRRVSASQLDRLPRKVGGRIDEAAINRILETLSLVGTEGILLEGVDARKLDPAIATEIKWLHWGGPIAGALQLLTNHIACEARERRKASELRARKKVARALKALSEARIALREVGLGDETKLGAAATTLAFFRDNIKGTRWTNERIAGEFLPSLYRISGKPPKLTRPSRTKHSGETVRFIQAFMRELGIKYSKESIIRAMQDAKKPKRPR